MTTCISHSIYNPTNFLYLWGNIKGKNKKGKFDHFFIFQHIFSTTREANWTMKLFQLLIAIVAGGEVASIRDNDWAHVQKVHLQFFFYEENGQNITFVIDVIWIHHCYLTSSFLGMTSPIHSLNLFVQRFLFLVK